jgi:hypothetical protein
VRSMHARSSTCTETKDTYIDVSPSPHASRQQWCIRSAGDFARIIRRRQFRPVRRPFANRDPGDAFRKRSPKHHGRATSDGRNICRRTWCSMRPGRQGRRPPDEVQRTCTGTAEGTIIPVISGRELGGRSRRSGRVPLGATAALPSWPGANWSSSTMHCRHPPESEH